MGPLAALAPLLAGIGTAMVPTATGGAAVAIGGMTVATTVGTLAGTAVSIASATGAFDPEYPEVPTPETSKDAEKARNRAVARAQRGITEAPDQTHQIGTKPVLLGQPTIVGGQ